MVFFSGFDGFYIIVCLVALNGVFSGFEGF